MMESEIYAPKNKWLGDCIILKSIGYHLHHNTVEFILLPIDSVMVYLHFHLYKNQPTVGTQ